MGRTDGRRPQDGNRPRRPAGTRARVAEEPEHDVSHLERTTKLKSSSLRGAGRNRDVPVYREPVAAPPAYGSRSSSMGRGKPTLDRRMPSSGEDPAVGQLILRVTGAEHQVVGQALLEEIVDMINEANEEEIQGAVEALHSRMKVKTAVRKKKASLQILRATMMNCTEEWVAAVAEGLLEDVSFLVPNGRACVSATAKTSLLTIAIFFHCLTCYRWSPAHFMYPSTGSPLIQKRKR